MYQTAPHLASWEKFWEIVQNGRFLLGRRVGQEVISKRRERIVSGKVTLPWGVRAGSLMQMTSSYFWGGKGKKEKSHVTDYLIGADQKFLIDY